MRTLLKTIENIVASGRGIKFEPADPEFGNQMVVSIRAVQGDKTHLYKRLIPTLVMEIEDDFAQFIQWMDGELSKSLKLIPPKS